MEKKDLKKYLLGILFGVSIAGCATSYFHGAKEPSNNLCSTIDDDELEEFKQEFAYTIENNENLKEEKSEIIKLFIDNSSFFDKYAKYIDRKEIIKRLKKLKMEYISDRSQDDFLSKKEKVVGYYSPSNMSITIMDEDGIIKISVAGHETMHFLSKGGFNKSGRLSILNEAITELLTRSLDDYKFMGSFYCSYFDYVIPFIEVVGKEEVLSCYFMGSEERLIEYLDKYTDRTDDLLKSLVRINFCDQELKVEEYSDEYIQILKEQRQKELNTYFSILGEIYENKNNQKIEENDFFNSYMYHSGLEGVVFNNEEMESRKKDMVNLEYNPFSDYYSGKLHVIYFDKCDMPVCDFGFSNIKIDGLGITYYVDTIGEWYSKEDNNFIKYTNQNMKR